MADSPSDSPWPPAITTTPSPPTSPLGLMATHAQLSFFIPSRSPFLLAEYIGAKTPETAAAQLCALERREGLFFDETVDVLFILKTPAGGRDREDRDAALQTALAGVRIALEAAVVNANSSASTTPNQSQIQGQAPPEDVIFSGGVGPGGVEDPPVVVFEEEDGDEDDAFRRWAYAAWTVPVFLQRPRMRFAEPTVIFRASAAFYSPKKSSSSSAKTYLTPGRPSSINLLAALAADPTTAMRTATPPHLTATRVSRVTPMTQLADSPTGAPSSPPSSSPSFAIPVAPDALSLSAHPAVQTRMRLSRHNASTAALPPARAGIIAVVEVDVTPHAAECEVRIDDVALKIRGADVVNLSAGVEGGGGRLGFPLHCVAHDHLTFLYRLTPTDMGPDTPATNPLTSPTTPSPSSPLLRELDITVRATALIGEHCRPSLVMNWTAPVDFSPPVNPGYGTATQPLNRPRRPSQLSFAPHENTTLSLISPSISRPDALPALDEAVAAAAAARSTELSIPDLGITLAFSAPAGPVVRVGEEFAWSVYVVNRPSVRPQGSVILPPRKLALIALPARTSTGHNPTTTTTTAPIAPAVTDQNTVLTLQRAAHLDLADVVCLSADARVGPLLPGACQVVDLRFVALARGILGLEAVRVVDLASHEHVDVRELPVMVVV